MSESLEYSYLINALITFLTDGVDDLSIFLCLLIPLNKEHKSNAVYWSVFLAKG